MTLNHDDVRVLEFIVIIIEFTTIQTQNNVISIATPLNELQLQNNANLIYMRNLTHDSQIIFRINVDLMQRFNRYYFSIIYSNNLVLLIIEYN